MNPWQILGWIVLGCVLLLIFCVLSLWGLWQDWATRSAFFCTLAVAGLPLLLGALWLLLRRTAARQLPAESALPVPAQFRESVQGQSLQHHWNHLLSEVVPCPLFLVLASSGAGLSTLLAEALPLSREIPSPGFGSDISLRISPQAAWLTVAPRLSALTNGTGQEQSPLEWTVPSNGTGWEMLLELLPSFPGALAGIVVLLAPSDLHAGPEALSEHEAPGLTPTLSLSLNRCLHSLRTRLGRPVPLWLLLDRLDQVPGGRAFCRDCAAVLPEIQRPLGITLKAIPPKASQSTRLHLLGNHLDQLMGALRLLLEACDTAQLGNPPLARHTLLLAHSLQSYKTALCLCADTAIQNGMNLAGVFLCGGAGVKGSGRIFVQDLFESTIPKSAQRFSRLCSPKPPRTAAAIFWALLAPLTLLLCTTWAAVLSLGIWQTGTILDALKPLARLQQGRGPEQTFPLPLLLEVTQTLHEQDTRTQGAARLFSVARTALHEGQAALESMILPLLPTRKDDSQLLSLWTQALSTWSAQQPEVAPLLFPAAGEVLTKVDAWASAAARRRVVLLLQSIQERLPQAEQARVGWILEAYDRQVFAAWRDSARALLQAQEADEQDMAPPLPHSPTKQALRLPVASRPTGQIRMQEALSRTAPTLRFMDSAARELAFSRSLTYTPPWILALCGLGEVRVLALQRTNSPAGSFPQNLKDRGRSLATLWHEESFVSQKPHNLDALVQAATAWRVWQDAVQALLPQALSRQGLSELLAGCFSGASNAPLTTADSSLRQLHIRLAALSPLFADGDTALAHALLESPLRMVRRQAMASVGQHMQASWQQWVLDPLRTVLPADSWSTLFDEEGLLQHFVDKAAAPYLQRGPEGFKPATALGTSFPFTPQFLRFLNGREHLTPAHPKKYPLTLHLLPVTVNADARTYPHGASVKLFCAGPPLEASALNNKKSLSFTWTPELCDGAELEIHFDDFSLTLDYPGRDGVQQFLFEVAKGGMSFTAADFPDFTALLQGAGVEFMFPRFRLQGAEALLSFLEDSGALVPTQIIQQPAQEPSTWK